jgi:hypothetical protein
MVLLWALAKGEAVSPDASQEMMGMLARSIPYQGIATGLPGRSTGHGRIRRKPSGGRDRLRARS